MIVVKRRLAATIALSAAIASCHKQPPPATQPAPIAAPPASPPSPGPSATNSQPGRPSGTDADAAAAQRRLAATVSEMIHFDYNIAELRVEAKAILDAKVAVLRSNPAIRIRITGNCDERGSDQYNIALGMRRATVAREYLMVAGVDPSRIEVASLGREVPIDDGTPSRRGRKTGATNS